MLVQIEKLYVQKKIIRCILTPLINLYDRLAFLLMSNLPIESQFLLLAFLALREKSVKQEFTNNDNKNRTSMIKFEK